MTCKVDFEKVQMKSLLSALNLESKCGWWYVNWWVMMSLLLKLKCWPLACWTVYTKCKRDKVPAGLESTERLRMTKIGARAYKCLGEGSKKRGGRYSFYRRALRHGWDPSVREVYNLPTGCGYCAGCQTGCYCPETGQLLYIASTCYQGHGGNTASMMQEGKQFDIEFRGMWYQLTKRERPGSSGQIAQCPW